jgi:hypothetical protein
MNGFADHHCPGCGAVLAAVPRYPWYFCKHCTATATDGDGRRLVFFNEGLSGGLLWGHDEHDLNRAPAVLCLIAGRPAVVTEARFGGKVAQPVPSSNGWKPPVGLIDLTRPENPGGQTS